MEKKPGQLSHDEIWDDSALVNSWNQALEEYKVKLTTSEHVGCTKLLLQKYHSIHAKGGKLRDLDQAGLNLNTSVATLETLLLTHFQDGTHTDVTVTPRETYRAMSRKTDRNSPKPRS
jgi:hypothetical protein